MNLTPEPNGFISYAVRYALGMTPAMIPCDRCREPIPQSYTLGEWVCKHCMSPMSFSEAMLLIGPEAARALLGSYTLPGAKRWFHRKRSQLGGFTPYEVLMTTKQRVRHLPDWMTSGAVERVQGLALALLQ